MSVPKKPIVLLSEMINNQEGIFFAILKSKTEAKTKDGKPYYRVTFADIRREVQTVIWADSPFFADCQGGWEHGHYYKIEGIYKVTDYGPKIVINRIREAKEKDFADGFSKNLCRPSSETDPSILIDEILTLAKSRIKKDSPLLAIIQRIFKEYRDRLLELPATRNHHHTYPGGFLEHTLSVAKIAVFLADHFMALYPMSSEKVSVELVAAGAILHEIGRIDEMEIGALTAKHSLAGELLGYPILGRDIVRRFAQNLKVKPDPEILLRLEHILLAHPRFADWGSVGVPISLEATIVHQADYADSIFAASCRILLADTSEEILTSIKGPFGGPLLK